MVVPTPDNQCHVEYTCMCSSENCLENSSISCKNTKLWLRKELVLDFFRCLCKHLEYGGKVWSLLWVILPALEHDAVDLLRAVCRRWHPVPHVNLVVWERVGYCTGLKSNVLRAHPWLLFTCAPIAVCTYIFSCWYLTALTWQGDTALLVWSIYLMPTSLQLHPNGPHHGHFTLHLDYGILWSFKLNKVLKTQWTHNLYFIQRN